MILNSLCLTKFMANMILKHVKFLNVLKLFVGLDLMFKNILKTIIGNYYYYLNLFVNQKLI
jgi:hypothetical protein